MAIWQYIFIFFPKIAQHLLWCPASLPGSQQLLNGIAACPTWTAHSFQEKGRGIPIWACLTDDSTSWCRKEMGDSLQTFSKAFSGMRMVIYWFKFTKVPTSGCDWQWSSIGLLQEAITWTSDDLVGWTWMCRQASVAVRIKITKRILVIMVCKY